MRILAVTNQYPTPRFPAVGTYVEQQVKGLRSIGLEVEVLHINRSEDGRKAYLQVARRALERTETVAPDLVHCMYGGALAEPVTRAIQDRPVIVSFCGSDLLGTHLWGFMRKLFSRYKVRLSYRAARRATGIVVKSQNLFDGLPADVDRSKVRIIPNGIDPERFRPLDGANCRERLGWRPDVFHALFSTNNGDPRKRPELARAALDLLEQSGIRVEMHSLQGIEHSQVPVWLNASHVLLHTSAQEGSANIVKEALACNLPIVAVDVGDNAERIAGVAGCYLAAAEPNDLAAKLRLVHDSGSRTNGREKIQELTLERIAMRLRDFYEEILGSATSPAVPGPPLAMPH